MARSLLLPSMVASPVGNASMVAFSVKFRLYLHVLLDVLAVVDVLAVDVLVDV